MMPPVPLPLPYPCRALVLESDHDGWPWNINCVLPVGHADGPDFSVSSNPGPGCLGPRGYQAVGQRLRREVLGLLATRAGLPIFCRRLVLAGGGFEHCALLDRHDGDCEVAW